MIAKNQIGRVYEGEIPGYVPPWIAGSGGNPRYGRDYDMIPPVIGYGSEDTGVPLGPPQLACPAGYAAVTIDGSQRCVRVDGPNPGEILPPDTDRPRPPAADTIDIFGFKLSTNMAIVLGLAGIVVVILLVKE